jgi:hypothetical protein
MKPSRACSGIVLSLAVLAGCKAAPVAVQDLSVAQVLPQGVALGAARVAGSAPEDGAANVRLTLRVAEPPAAGFRLMGVPAAWTEATVSLVSPTVSSTYDLAKHTRTLAKSEFTANADGTYTGRFAFPPMRPADNYEGRVYVKNLAGTTQTTRLAGSATKSGISLRAGSNPLAFDVQVNGQEATYLLTGSEINVVDGNAVTKGDVVTLETGLARSQPGVDHLDVKLSGACYGNGSTTVLVKRLTTATSWDAMTWSTDADSEQFRKDQLKGGTDFGALAGRLDFEAYNERGELVGRAATAIQVFGRPEVSLRLR